MLSRRRSIGAALVLTAAWGVSAQAAVLQLAPIPVEVEAPQAAAVLSLSNRAPAEVALQARVFRWTQTNGEDRLEPTQDVVVSPPIATLPAGQTLTLRVVRVVGQPVAAEETYRILVDELPSDKRTAKGQSLRILMRYSVPVFYAPAEASKDEPALSWQLKRGAKGALTLTATNPGARRVRFSELQLVEPASKAAALAKGSELSGYVLAGHTMHWTVPAAKDFPARAGGTYRLEYRTEAKQHRDNLSLGAAH
jgi:fimbrial chaperone protein